LIGFDDAYTPESFRKTYGGSISLESMKSPPEAKYILIYGVPPPNQYAFFRAALKAEHAEAVLVPEMRPALWGAQVVAPELKARNVPATLISDNTMGMLFAQGEIRKLCLFYESLSSEGPVGISGSLLAVRLARLHGVEIELFDGAHAKNQTRDRDISTFLGNNICPAGVTIRTVEPEVISWTLLRG